MIQRVLGQDLGTMQFGLDLPHTAYAIRVRNKGVWLLLYTHLMRG